MLSRELPRDPDTIRRIFPGLPKGQEDAAWEALDDYLRIVLRIQARLTSEAPRAPPEA